MTIPLDSIVRRRLLAAAALTPCLPRALAADAAWDRTERAARGQTVYFNAWAGSENLNAYRKQTF